MKSNVQVRIENSIKSAWGFSRAAALVGSFAAATCGSFAAAQGPAIAYPPSNWSYIDHSSSYAEGVLRGQASVLSAAGELAYMDSLASINYQEAQRRAIDNSVALTKAYFEKKEIKIEFDKKYGRKPLVGEARKKVIEHYMPKKLTAEEFNPANGQLVWPHILRQPEYGPIKLEIDTLFASRKFENSGDGSDTQRKISQLIRSMSALVRENIAVMSAEQYIDAQEFLRSVDAEAKSTVSPDLNKPAEAADVAPKAEVPVKTQIEKDPAVRPSRG